MKNWIKEHTDTLVIVGSMIAGVWTIKSDIHSLDQRLTDRISGVESRATAIETALIMQGAPLKAIVKENTSGSSTSHHEKIE
jgi:hypothetical protein